MHKKCTAHKTGVEKSITNLSVNGNILKFGLLSTGETIQNKCTFYKLKLGLATQRRANNIVTLIVWARL